MSKLSAVQNKTIEEYWSSLDELKKQLRYREWELLNAHQETDANFGGGKSNRISDNTGNKAIKTCDISISTKRTNGSMLQISCICQY